MPWLGSLSQGAADARPRTRICQAQVRDLIGKHFLCRRTSTKLPATSRDRDMAFCPNCGTPNTDQAEKCVSCAFELAPKQKAKFKGTIMMQNVQLPAGGAKPAQPAAPTAAPPSPAPAPAPTPAATAPQSATGSGKNVGFEKTM